MGMPYVATALGTATSTAFIPDWTIAPFQVGIAVVFSGAAGTAIVQATLDCLDPLQANGTTPAAATWFTIAAAASVTAVLTNFTTPVQGLRVAMITAVATSAVAATFVQAGNSQRA